MNRKYQFDPFAMMSSHPISLTEQKISSQKKLDRKSFVKNENTLKMFYI